MQNTHDEAPAVKPEGHMKHVLELEIPVPVLYVPVVQFEHLDSPVPVL